MESEDERKHQSIQRCDDLLREQRFPGTAVRAAAKRLAVIRSELDRLAAREEKARGMVPWDGREIRKRCRNLRREYLTPISRAAKAIEGFMRDAPGAKEALKLPHVTAHAKVHIEAGERFSEFLAKHRAGFLRETRFDRNILSKLRAATDELRTQTAFAATWRNERTAVIRELKRLIRNGRRQIDLLSNMLEPLLMERGLEDKWAQARRVGAKLGRRFDTPAERLAKRIAAAKAKAAKLEAKLERREQAKAGRAAKKAAKQASADQPAAAPPLTKAVFLERLAEEGGEVER